MKRHDLLSLDILKKEDLAYVSGGDADKKLCGCTCVGPVEDGGGSNQGGEGSSGGKDITDLLAQCGHANAERAKNEGSVA